VKPMPIIATDVRIQDMSVRSTDNLVRSHEKWLSDVERTSKRPSTGAGVDSID
jgi:hypothetical protein